MVLEPSRLFVSRDVSKRLRAPPPSPRGGALSAARRLLTQPARLAHHARRRTNLARIHHEHGEAVADVELARERPAAARDVADDERASVVLRRRVGRVGRVGAREAERLHDPIREDAIAEPLPRLRLERVRVVRVEVARPRRRRAAPSGGARARRRRELRGGRVVALRARRVAARARDQHRLTQARDRDPTDPRPQTLDRPSSGGRLDRGSESSSRRRSGSVRRGGGFGVGFS